MQSKLIFAFALVTSLSLGSSIPACPLCGGARPTMRQQLSSAQMAFIGHVNTVRKTEKGNVTEFVVDKILKGDDKAVKEGQSITIARLIPVEDEKDSKPFVLLCEMHRGELSIYAGIPSTKAFAKYVTEMWPLNSNNDAVAMTRYFLANLDHKDSNVSEDALHELASMKEDDQRKVAKHLDNTRLRYLVANKESNNQLLTATSLLLAYQGDAKDAALIGDRLNDSIKNPKAPLDGLLVSYTILNPKDGLLKITSFADPNVEFLRRYHAYRAFTSIVRIAPSAFTKAEIKGTYTKWLQAGDLCDVVIENLRSTKYWDLSNEVIECQSKFPTKLVRRAVLRYAVQCPDSQSRVFVKKAAEKDKSFVDEIAAQLASEQIAFKLVEKTTQSPR